MNPANPARDELPPRIIQGGMGVAVSNWRLARAVSMSGQLGVVSGTAIDVVMSRTLQLGDPGGNFRRALAAFPLRDAAERILRKHFIEGGKAPGAPVRGVPMVSHQSSRETTELVMAANFSAVHLAKDGHDGWVGLVQCHANLDRVGELQIVFHADRTRSLEVTATRNIGQAFVEGASLQLRDIGADSQVCLRLQSRALSATV